MANKPNLYSKEGRYYAYDGEHTVPTTFEQFVETFNTVAVEVGVLVRIAPLDVTWDQWKKMEDIALKRIVKEHLDTAKILEDL